MALSYGQEPEHMIFLEIMREVWFNVMECMFVLLGWGFEIPALIPGPHLSRVEVGGV